MPNYLILSICEEEMDDVDLILLLKHLAKLWKSE